MAIYEKTDIGRSALKDFSSPLPRKLRSLLVAIDGNTHLTQYVKNLSAFGDVQSMFNSLIQNGYIKHRDANNSAVKRVEFFTSITSQQARLTNCITQISNFFTDHMPERAIEMILIFEGINSLHELETNLPGYEKMIASLGSVAQQHIQALKQQLDHH